MTEFCCKWNIILWLRLSTSRTKTDINGGRVLYATGYEEDRWGDTLSAYSLNLMLQLSGLKFERWSRSEKFTLLHFEVHMHAYRSDSVFSQVRVITFFSFPVVDWFCLFICLWVLTFPLLDCSEFGNFVITLIYCLFTYST